MDKPIDWEKVGPGQGVPYIDYLPDNHEEALATYPVMARPCADCAYTTGTSAAADPITSRKAAECAEVRCAFWCHKAHDPKDAEFKTHLCAGWKAAIEARSAAARGGRDG